MRFKILFLASFLFGLLRAQAQILTPVVWSSEYEKLENGNYKLIFSAKIDPGWYVYTQYLEDDAGPLPTSITYDDSTLVTFEGIGTESGGREESFDKFWGFTLVKFVSEYTITQEISVNDPAVPITGYLTYMTCDEDQCLPPKDVEFEFDLSDLQAAVVPDVKKQDEDISLSGLEGIDQTIATLQETGASPVGQCLTDDVLVERKSLLWTFILGFLGGLLALLTPCVFPMIPLTVSFFTKSSKDRRSGIRNGILYGLSIVVIYISIGLLITAFFGETALNMLSTNWIANSLFFLIFLLFALSFFGFFEITLPGSWSNKTDSLADKGGLIGIFFMAFTLAIVSFSCTGPIIGTAIVQSATDKLGPFIVMLGFSSALALPFGLFAAFPAWLNSLPKSGSWMNSVKVVLGFLELALAFKFLSVADMTSHWNFLRYELFMGLWILIFGGMALYLFGFLKFPHDSPMKRPGILRLSFASLTTIFTIYLITGLFKDPMTQTYNAKKLMSGLAPPAHYNYFMSLPDPNSDIKKRFPSYSKCANNLDCFKDYYEGVQYAAEVNKPILLDFTGYGCVNCRKTEEHIWTDDKVWNNLKKEYVLISLYVDDDRKLKEMLYSIPRNEKLRKIGHLWADFQIVNFQQNSQPLYVMVTPDEQVLARPRGYRESVQGYADFLECGIESFKELNGLKGSD